MSVHTRLTPRRGHDIGRGLLGLLAVLALAVGTPTGLVVWIGWPLPTALPELAEVTAALRDAYVPDEFLVKALALVCWLVWFELLTSVTVEAIAHVRGRRAGAVPLAGNIQRGAARLVAAIALLGALASTRGTAPEPAAQARASLVPSDPPAALVVDDEAPAPAAHPAAPVSTTSAARYEVQRRDTLWDIAERHLGDPFRWEEILRLNEGRPQDDGRCLVDPDMIHPGWRLELPADAVGLGEPAPTSAPSAPAAPSRPAPAPASTPDPEPMVLLDHGGEADGGGQLVAEPGPGAEAMVLLPDEPGGGAPPVLAHHADDQPDDETAANATSAPAGEDKE